MPDTAHPGYEVERDRFGVMYSGPLEVGECRRVVPVEEVERLRDLVATLWLYIGRYAEKQLTTEQKELLYDVVEAAPGHEDDEPMERWWR